MFFLEVTHTILINNGFLLHIDFFFTDKFEGAIRTEQGVLTKLKIFKKVTGRFKVAFLVMGSNLTALHFVLLTGYHA